MLASRILTSAAFLSMSSTDFTSLIRAQKEMYEKMCCHPLPETLCFHFHAVPQTVLPPYRDGGQPFSGPLAYVVCNDDGGTALSYPPSDT